MLLSSCCCCRLLLVVVVVVVVVVVLTALCVVWVSWPLLIHGLSVVPKNKFLRSFKV